MKFFNFKIQMTWLATWLSVATMVASPVAMGEEAQKISKQQAQSALEQLGLNKPMTVGEFYKKNKYLFPDRISKELEPILANYKNVMMPKVQLSASTGTDGREVPTVSMDFNGQLINLQLFGEKERFAKFQNTNLTEVDIVNFGDMLSRVLAGDEVLRKQQEALQVQAPTAEFSGLPVLDKNTWKKMTLQERASYMVQIRHLWLDARQVLELQKKPAKARKTAGLESFENFWSVLVGSNADAGPIYMNPENDPNNKAKVAAAGKPTPAPAAKPGTPKPAAPAKNTPKAFAKATATYGSSCLVAGYSAKYNGGICDHTKLLESYSSSAFVTNMNNKCKEQGPSQMACNPLVYGTPGGNPICITASTNPKSDFQIATHFGGPCDSKSLLQSSPNAVKFLKDENKKVGRYDDDNLIMNEEQRKEFFRKEQEANNFAETKAFVEGVLKVNDPNITDIFANGVLTDATIAQLIDVQTQFNKEIAESVKACKTATNEKNAKHETKFHGACDQLQRRFLFISDLLKSKCEAGSEINPGTLKCTCADKKTEVVPGGSCKAAPTVPAPNEPPTQQPPANPPAVKPPPKDKPCAAGTHAVTVTGSQSGAVSTTCEPDKKADDPNACGIFCKIGKFFTWSAPVLIPAVALFAMYKIFSPKKPKLNPAGDMCPNGAIPPCGQVCALPLSNINGICACAACPPGQTISSATTCACSSSSTTTTYTCWDGVTKVSDLTQCPAQTYTCWDGSKVTNALNCPEKPTTTTPTTKTETGR